MPGSTLLRPRVGLLAALVALALAACSTSDDTSATYVGSSGLSTSEPGTTAATDDPSTSGAGTGTGSSGTGTTADPSTGTTAPETTAASASASASDSDACPPGTLGCPCDGDACDGDLLCVAGACAAPLTCKDVDAEPNDVEADAVDLGEITDGDGKGSTFPGVLAGKADVDWFKYSGKDTALHTTEPTRDVVFTKSARFCKFLECVNGGVAQTEVSCPPGTDFAMSPDLRPGCCSGQGFELKDYNCPGTDDSVHVYMRFDKPLFDECVPYTVAYFL